MTTRREFITKTTCAAGLLPLSVFPFQNIMDVTFNNTLDVNIFSKHLQFLDYKKVGEMAAEMGFSGVDLTVRPNGHVLPELVKTELPKAIKAINEAGSKCKMITTSIESVDNAFDVDILESASASNISYYRTNWFQFKEHMTMEDTLLYYQNEVKKLGDLNKNLVSWAVIKTMQVCM